MTDAVVKNHYIKSSSLHKENLREHNLFHCMEVFSLIQGKSDIFSGGWHNGSQ